MHPFTSRISDLASPDEEKDRRDMAGEGEGLVEDEEAGLEGFANSPGDAEEVGSDEEVFGGMKEEGHEDDLGEVGR
jgi:hypothetical protein